MHLTRFALNHNCRLLSIEKSLRVHVLRRVCMCCVHCGVSVCRCLTGVDDLSTGGAPRLPRQPLMALGMGNITALLFEGTIQNISFMFTFIVLFIFSHPPRFSPPTARIQHVDIRGFS